MVCVALVIPAYWWLGAGVIGLFVGDSFFAYFHARHLGLAARIPIHEPYLIIATAGLGGALLFLRERRRRLALRHIEIEGEAVALRRVGPVLERVGGRLSDVLQSISQRLNRLDANPAPRMSRALDRLSQLNGKLELLVTDPSPAGEGGLRASERELLDRDAHIGAMVLALFLATASTSIGLVARAPGLHFSGLAIGCWLVVAYLFVTRKRPSQTRALWTIIITFTAGLAVVSYNEAAWLRLNQPYTPLVAHKALLVIPAFVAASRRWLAVTMILVTLASGFWIYWALELYRHKDILSWAEPWTLLVYAVSGFAATLMSEQRLVGSIELLRLEAEGVSLARRCLLFLALRDQFNSPLQTLVLGTAQLEASGTPLENLHADIEELVALSSQLVELDAVIPEEFQRLSLDADRGLRRSDLTGYEAQHK
jgi:hypothetical protein